jgi:hypothetical protein
MAERDLFGIFYEHRILVSSPSAKITFSAECGLGNFGNLSSYTQLTCSNSRNEFCGRNFVRVPLTRCCRRSKARKRMDKKQFSMMNASKSFGGGTWRYLQVIANSSELWTLCNYQCSKQIQLPKLLSSNVLTSCLDNLPTCLSASRLFTKGYTRYQLPDIMRFSRSILILSCKTTPLDPLIWY